MKNQAAKADGFPAFEARPQKLPAASIASQLSPGGAMRRLGRDEVQTARPG